MTIAENIERIETAKEAIKDAIVSKGGQVSEDARIDEYPAVIEALPSGGDDTLDKIFDQTVEEIHNTTPVKYGRYLFTNQPKLRVADIVLSDNVTETYQYQYMFQNCSSLTQAPALPATTLANYCYSYMFQYCSSLTEAPALPATTLANYCYQYMFRGCNKLTEAPALPATTLASSCYYYMFSGCTALTQAPELQTTTLANFCYGYMFDGCTSLTKAPDLPATKMNGNCYQYMFSGCTSLTQAPDLPATTLNSNCYENMFSGCTSLQKTGIIAATGSITNPVTDMFSGCTSLKEMTWTSTTPPTIGVTIWTNCPEDMVIYVPDESVDAYKAARVWNSRAAYIKPISEKPTE